MKKAFYFMMFIAVSFAYGQDYTSALNSYLNSNKAQLGLQSQDFEDIIVDRHSYSKSMELENVYVVQRYQGIEIFNSNSSFAIKNGAVVYSSLSFSENVLQKVNTTSSSISAGTAIANAAQELGLNNLANLELLETTSVNSYVYSKGNISLENIPVKLVFQKMEDNSLRLAWDLSIYVLDASHYYSVRVDAVSGALINTGDWVISCNFEAHAGHSELTHNENSILFSQEEAMTMSAGGAQYRVFPIPTESPIHGPDVLIADPSQEGEGSPYGWHDTDGADGAEYTITRGNNVWSKDDINNNNGTDGVSADGGAGLNFDFPYEFDEHPNDWIEAATVNLFYMNNIMHDVYYQYGFDEESGNFQEMNYSGLGSGSDSVNADAQDGGGTNNANFATPPDGSNPRMQMYLWSAATGDLMTVNNGPLAGGYFVIEGTFGAPLTTTPLTEDLVVVEDDDSGVSEDPTDACDVILNGADINGKIAILRRGECEFGFKALAVQNEGAIAVIIVNNVPGDPVGMAGGAVGDQVTIPNVMISMEEGDAMIAEILGGGTVNVTLVLPDVAMQPIDGDLDNGIIAHEYGHGVSNRLTGGPGSSGCLNNAEQMGEGWSDWLGLMLTIQPGDDRDDARGVGTYAQGQSPDGTGIRQYPYSFDQSVNPLTYADLPATGGQVHAVGTIWATIIWDLSWILIDEHGFDPDLYHGTGGNNIAMQLVIDGMKLQPCSPGFEDGRDAILAADLAANGGANECIIWNAFARRGLGFSASQGGSGSTADGTAAFDLPDGCNPLGVNDNGSIEDKLIIYPNPSNGNINIRALIDLGDATISIYDINGREVFNQEVTLQDNVNVNATNLNTGMYIMKIEGVDYNHTAKLIIN